MKMPKLKDLIRNTNTLVVVPDINNENENEKVELKAGDKIIIDDNTMYLISYAGWNGKIDELRAINIETGKLGISGNSREIIYHFKSKYDKVYLCKQVVIETTDIEEI